MNSQYVRRVKVAGERFERNVCEPHVADRERKGQQVTVLGPVGQAVGCDDCEDARRDV